MESKTILVTAFEPFGGEALNPTELLLDKLPDSIGDCSVSRLLLPVEFIRSKEMATDAYDRISPDAVIMLGQAGGRSAITPETTAVNVMNSVRPDMTRPDNAGYAPDHLPVSEGGPETLSSTLPVEKIAEAVSAAGIPCEISDDAGQYVCNNVFYSMLEHNKGEVPTGFIHIPFAKEQGHDDSPYLELDEMFSGIIEVIKAVIK